ncbi:MAG TPA: zinc metalloprotease HtpX [Candidatus Nanoarchaeia archaeon]|nr:zinc metalloprotease HtpX [Candidatus Nanoarchaeia archaeon]
MTIKNQLKTVLLLSGLTGLLLLIGAWAGGKTGLTMALIFAGGMNFVSYWWSDKIVLWMYKAKLADKKQYARLYAMIKEIASKAHLPMPKVYIIDTPQSNAFATGRNPDHAAVAVTTGILQLLEEKELRAVLAHELGHVKNRDILISTIAATVAGVISYIAMMARWAAIFGGMNRDDNQSSGSNILELLLLAILAPLMAMVIQLAISRSREYQADETGAHLSKDPLALASALEKIEKNVHNYPFARMGKTEATAHLFIANPLKASSFLELFSTHPSTENRVKRLKEMKV